MDFLSRWEPQLLSVMRIAVALLFMEHGTQKLFELPFPAPRPPPEAFTLGWFAGIVEFVGGGLMALGLWTRYAAFIASGTMAFAYFISHEPRGFYPIFNGGDRVILYSFVFLFFTIAGAGPWSVDALLGRRKVKMSTVQRPSHAR